MMQLPVALFLALVLLGTKAQDRATFWRGNDQGGRCQYSFTVDSPTEYSCPVAMGRPEVEALKTRLSLLESQMNRLLGGEVSVGQPGPLLEAHSQVMQEKTQLQRDKQRLEKQVQDLQRRLEEMQQETDRLRARPCYKPPPPSVQLHDGSHRPGIAYSSPTHLSSITQGQSERGKDQAWSFGSLGFQELKAEVTELPASHLNEEREEDTAGCGELVWVGEAVSHRKADSISGKYGVWMQDPEAVSPYSTNMIWRIDTVGNEVRQLFGYEDLDQLSRGFPTKVLILPEPMESTGAMLYHGSLYYQRRRSRTLLRYDLATESIAARRDLPHAGFHGQYPYSWGGYTDIDLAVDEQGVWAIYSSNKAKGAIVLSQLDPNSLAVKQSWETNIRKNTVANAFMICGRLYTVASYTAPNTTISHTFDTATGESKTIAIPFRNRYRYNSMVDYNPAQKKLYAWDNFHMVSYDVRLGTPQDN